MKKNNLPRGLRNNNPLNIRKGCKWQGLEKNQTDPDFCQFRSLEYGFRAAFKVLNTYYVGRGLKTIEKIVSRWAPPNENNTNKYISFVERNTWCIRYKEILPPRFDPDLWIAIVKAMTIMECGRWNKKLEGAEKRGYNLAFNKE